MRIAIIGAAGQIPKFLIPKLLNETKANLTLFAKNAVSRLVSYANPRVRIVSGNADNFKQLKTSIIDANIIFIDFDGQKAISNIIKAMDELKKKRLIVAGVLGVHNEVAGAFGKWNQQMIGRYYGSHKAAIRMLEHSDLNYTYMRMTWLYNQKGNTKYKIEKKGQPLIGAQVTRQAVSQYIVDLIKNPDLGIRESNGVVEPNTNFAKPSFY